MKIIFLLFVTATAMGQTTTPPIVKGGPAPSASASPSPPPGLPPSAGGGEKSDQAVISNLLSGIIEDYNYEAKGKRDPFLPFDLQISPSMPVTGPFFPLQKFDIEQLRLVGIIWDVRNPRAMIIDPSGKGYVVKLNDRIGRNNGYVARIREGEIIIIESFKSPEGRTIYQTKLVKIATE